ncbi:hypothetical protein E8D34_14160 [Nocardioides sp. GY 10113]|uniref:GerMN domain-containing protein n=1 Tax=Nocardioides sp. GY 10113 TaxID=2569761 RepID=UPI0010A93A63|nr:GerMN domain-containing protein [Nocardioides sp. GY 10113]TIC84850.1 hypothetical protein E8D34_14160 [Nocardioides sp. GY 10113]
MPDRPDQPEAGDPRSREAPAPDELRSTLHHAAAGLAPGDRLGDVRRRIRARATTRAPRRWLPVAVGAAVATAAVVVAAVTVGQVTGAASRPPAAGRTPTAATAGGPVALYFVAETATGPRLFREFATLPGVVSTPDGATPSATDATVLAALGGLAADRGPADPDYRTLWPAGAFTAAAVRTGQVVVDLAPAALRRPPGVSRGEALLGLQQVVYTAEAAIGRAVPVRFTVGGEPAPTVLGLGTRGTVDRDRQYAVTAVVNISDPAEGQRGGDTLTGGGTIGEYVPAVRWTLTTAGGRVVEQGRARILAAGEGGTTEHARGWETPPIDLAGLPAGEYTFTALVRSVGQGSGAPATFTDDRTVVVP